MIFARQHQGVLIFKQCPEIGETIYVDSLGHGLVEHIQGCGDLTRIRIEFKETLVGSLVQEFPFEVKE